MGTKSTSVSDERVGFDGQMVTKKQLRFLEAIEKLWREGLRAPSWRELAREVGIKSLNSVKEYIDVLEAKNLVSRMETGGRFNGSGLRGPERTIRTSRMKTGMGRFGDECGVVVFWG